MRHYAKELTALTSVRLTPSVRQAAEAIAGDNGMSLSDFVRQSVIRNIIVSRTVEQEVRRRAANRALGYDE